MGMLLNKYTVYIALAVLAIGGVFHGKQKLNSMQDEMFIQRDARAVAEDRVLRCNQDIELANMRLENESIASALRQAERMQIMEDLNEERSERKTLADQIRERARVSLDDQECAVVALPDDTSWMLRNAFATANSPD